MRSPKTKRIITFLLAAIVGTATFFAPIKDTLHHTVSTPIVYAAGADAAPTPTDSQKDFANILDIILKVIYLLLWPFLALAGLALDNGLVYGSYFQLDAALFTFRNIVKNFANFALGFLFLWSILKYIFNFGSKATNPMSMISKLLIAGIGIQASWFAMGALIDISTVATVGIGGLPLQLLKEEDVGKKPLFGIHTTLKISDLGDTLTTDKGFVILYTYPTTPDQYYLPCAVVSQELLKDDKWAEAFGVAKKDGTVDPSAKIGNSDVTRDKINKDYCIFGNNMLAFSAVGSSKIQPGSDELKKMLVDSQAKFRSDNKCDGAGANVCQTVANIAEKGKGYQGAFYSLYGSLLNLGSIHVNVNKSEGSMTMEALIKTIIGIAYLVPLIVLCVVLIIRIAVLWITIAFSPVLVLSEVFGFKMGDLQKFGLKNAISMIFLPVMATFSISISIVFLSVLSEGLTKGTSLDEIGMGTSAQGNKTCINLVITSLCIDNPSQDIGVSGMLDFFPWIILNIFGIGLMRTILMITMKSTSFTSGVVDSLDKFAKNMVQTANIIPLGGGTSIAAVKNAGNRISGEIQSAASRNAQTVVSPTLENIIQGSLTNKVGTGKTALDNAATNINSPAAANKELSKLVGSGGALYNAANTGFGIKGNQLDLNQYGASGLSLINKVAAQGNLKPYSSVDNAFKDPSFLNFLAKKESNGGIGLTKQQIKDLYSGRDGTGDRDHQEVIALIDALADDGAPTPGVWSVKDKTYTADGNIYTMAPNGFMKKGADGKTITLTKEAEWNTIGISKDNLDAMRKANATITPSTEFNNWIIKNTPAVNPPAGATTTTNTAGQNTTTTSATNTTNTTNNASSTTTTTPPPPPAPTP